MQEAGADGGGSKLETGVRQIVRTLETLGSSRWLLIDSASNTPRQLDSVADLLKSSATGPASASADVPAMLQATYDYIKANKTGRTEVWICSDIRENDWNADGGRWQALRDGFHEFAQGVRFHLLAYPKDAAENRSIRVTGVRRRKTADGAELIVSLRLSRRGGNEADREQVPVHIEIDGARSEVTVELVGRESDLRDHRIAIDKSRARGWGRVSIPADANPADNDFWFVFEQPTARKAVVVADDPLAARPLQLAASISPDPAVPTASEVIGVDQVTAVDWDQVALVLWEAPLPQGPQAKSIQAFIDRGGSVVFFPPRGPDATEFLGARWTDWKSGAADIPLETWRGDEDLLARTESGAPLPVGALQIHKYRGISGELTALASLKGGAPLLARATTNHGAAYFCATTAAPGDSSLATGGVVLYVMVQRALAAGASVLGTTRQLVAGEPPRDERLDWTRVEGSEEALSTEYPAHRGIYQSGERLLAVNRSAAEERSPALADTRVAALFSGLDYARVDDTAGSASSLIQEIWRLFLITMMTAMVAEAALCLPRKAPRTEAPRS
jgi:hypothetical protein